MRVAIDARGLATAYENKGVGYYIKSIINGLPKVASDIEFVFFLGDKESEQYIPKEKNVKSVILKRSWKRGWLEDLLKLYFEIKRSKADLYHCPIVLGPIRSINIPYFSPVPVVSTIHDLHVEMLNDPHMIAYKNELRYKLQRKAVKKTTVIAVSKFTKNHIVQKQICESKNITVIPNCINVEEFSPSKKEKIILFIGDGEHKNTSAVVKVFKILSEKIPDWKFIMVGSKERIYSLGGLYAKELQASNIMQIEENVPDSLFYAIFSKAQILFMPSLSEGFGIPVLQAFASDTCAVISDRGALPEVGGQAAIYVNPDDSTEMVSTLEGLTKNISLQQILVEKGRERTKEFFWDAHLRNMIKVYKKALK